MMAIGPYEDNEETRHDLDEARRARMFSLVRAPPILVGPSSRLIRALIGRSTYSKLACKWIESRDPS